MKSIHFAIASIVDANTGIGLQRDVSANGQTAAEQRGRSIRARSIIALLASIGRRLAAIPATLQAYSERKRKIGEVTSLTDRQLDDIGLSRGDVVALQHGVIGLDDLETRRIGNLGSKRIKLYRDNDTRHAVGRQAANEANFARVKCA